MEIGMNFLMIFQDENPFYGDRLIRGGNQKDLTNGLDYEEVSSLSQIKSID